MVALARALVATGEIRRRHFQDHHAGEQPVRAIQPAREVDVPIVAAGIALRFGHVRLARIAPPVVLEVRLANHFLFR